MLPISVIDYTGYSTTEKKKNGIPTDNTKLRLLKMCKNVTIHE